MDPENFELTIIENRQLCPDGKDYQTLEAEGCRGARTAAKTMAAAAADQGTDMSWSGRQQQHFVTTNGRDPQNGGASWSSISGAAAFPHTPEMSRKMDEYLCPMLGPQYKE